MKTSGIFAIIMMIMDMAMTNLSILLGYHLRFRASLLPSPQEFHPLADYLGLALLETVLFPLIFFAQRGYRIKKGTSKIDELSRVFSVVSIGTVLTMAFSVFVSREFNYSRGLLTMAWMLAIVLIWVARLVQYGIHSLLRSHGVGREKIIIVGTGEMARAIYQRICHSPRLGYQVVGFVGQEDQEQTADATPVIGPITEVSNIVHEKGVNEVIIAEPALSHRDVLDIVAKCEKEKVNIKVFPDVFQIITSEASIGDLNGLPMVSVRDIALRGWNLTLKRIVDLGVAGGVLVAFSPFMLLIALLTKVTYPKGPVFYVQERVGLDGQPFWVIKFRTMKMDAEEETGPVWARKGDPRTTRLGAFLRRFSIDEMPQFINVLLGEMSMVGPRPERPYFVEQFSQRVPRYLERHKEKTGLTGWAQIHGLRGNVGIEERLAYDLWYVENWTLGLDFKIMLRTMLAIIRGDNAY